MSLELHTQNPVENICCRYLSLEHQSHYFICLWWKEVPKQTPTQTQVLPSPCPSFIHSPHPSIYSLIPLFLPYYLLTTDGVTSRVRYYEITRPIPASKDSKKTHFTDLKVQIYLQSSPGSWYTLFLSFLNYFIIFLASLGLHCCAGAFSSCAGIYSAGFIICSAQA